MPQESTKYRGDTLESQDALHYPQRLTTATTLLSMTNGGSFCGISPLVWRRVLVWSDITLSRRHAILQSVFARSDEHIQFPHPHVLSEGSFGNIAGGAVVGSKWPCLPETLVGADVAVHVLMP